MEQYKNQRIFTETEYRDAMRDIVEPTLQNCRQEGFLTSTYGQQSGKQIYYARYRTARPERVVLISHGFTESAEKYRETIYYFLQQHYHVYIMEHCGHGRSYRLTDDLSKVHVDRYERYVENLLLVARQIHKEYPELPLEIYGHSMGGGIAAAAAATAPELFHRIVLSSPMIRPVSGAVPWWIAKGIAHLACALGQSEHYVPGHHPYDGLETFAESASLLEERFQYDQELRQSERRFQGNGASYGWLREAARLNHFLQTKAPGRITATVLLLQAGRDTFVDNKEQTLFMEKLRRYGKGEIYVFPEAKHELYHAKEEDLERYYSILFQAAK